MYRSIVVGIDGSASSLQALQRALDLATGREAVVHLVCAHRPLSTSQLDFLRDAVPQAYRDRVQPDMVSSPALGAATALADAAGVDHRVHGPEGTPSDIILAVADEVDADLIIVGSRGLGASQRLILGSVSSTLAQDSPIDVLIVRRFDEDDETVDTAFGRLGEAASRFETDHPMLTKTINDVSHFLSGLGI